MPKEEIKRYTISIIEKISSRRVKTEEELRKLLSQIDKYNSKDTNPYFIGNIEINRSNGIVTFTQYKKITERTTLENIDKVTSYYRNDFDLKTLYNVDYKNRHPLIITYRSNKQIRVLEIVYKAKSKYLDRSYVKQKYIEYASDMDFINKILKNKQIEASFTNNLDDFDILFKLREELKYELPAIIDKTPMYKFYSSAITKNGKLNYFNFRLLGMLLKEYEKDIKEEEIEEEPKEIIGQLSLEEFVMEDLREKWEEAKIMVTQASLEEAYENKLIKRHKTTK